MRMVTGNENEGYENGGYGLKRKDKSRGVEDWKV